MLSVRVDGHLARFGCLKYGRNIYSINKKSAELKNEGIRAQITLGFSPVFIGTVKFQIYSEGIYKLFKRA